MFSVMLMISTFFFFVQENTRLSTTLVLTLAISHSTRSVLLHHRIFLQAVLSGFGDFVMSHISKKVKFATPIALFPFLCSLYK
jgi:hypothetical protein